MESCSQLYTKKIVNSIIHNLEQKHSNILFVKHYNTLNLSLEDIEESVCKSKSSIELFYYEYSASKMQKAYEPFLEWIKQLYYKYYFNVPLDEFLEKCDVYFLSRSAIKTYINGGTDGRCKRDEEVIIVELEYERKQFASSLTKILLYIAQEHTLLFVLNKLHLVGSSTLDFLLELIKSHSDNISLLANYNEAYIVPAYMSEIWLNFINQLEEYNYILDWNIQDAVTEANITETFEPILRDFPNYLVLINNMLETLATKQAIYYLDIIYNKIFIEKVNISIKNKVSFFILYAVAALHERNMTISLMMCEKIKSISIKHPNDKYSFSYYYLLTMCQVYSGQPNLAKKNTEKCRRIAKKVGTEEYMLYAEMLYYTVLLDGWTNSYRWDRCDESESLKLFSEQAMKYKKYNHLAHTLFFACCNEKKHYINDEDKCENQPSFQNAMKIAQMLKNERLIIAAWRKNVFMAQGYGCFSSVDYYYKKCLEIIERQDNKSEEASIYNGLGYNRIVSEQFIQANDYFNKALTLFYNLKDTYNIAETLYNMATNAILAEEYETAYNCLVRCLKLLDSIKMHSMKICNISKVYGMLVICSYRMGIEYNANFYLNKMENVLNHLLHSRGKPNFFLWDDDMFFYYFGSGLLAKSDNIQLAQEYFDKARFHMFRTEGLLFFVYAQFALEQADLYEEQGEHEKACDILNKCIEFCNEKGYKHKEEMLFARLHDQSLITKHISLPLTGVTKYQLDEMTKISEMETLLSDKTKGINFLVAWQDLINKENINIDDIIENSMVTIQNYYNVDCIIYVELVNGHPVLKYNGTDIDINDDMLQNMTDYLQIHKKEFVCSRFESEFYEYSADVSGFGLENIVSFACVPIISGEELSGYMIAYIEIHDNMSGNLFLLDRNDLTIFKFALRQLNDAIYRFKTRDEIREINNKLQQSAVTDLLTGLLNRQGFAKKVDDYTQLVKNGAQENICATVMYIDLDNFKFCNDTFGHDVGDAILIAFSRLFEATVGDKGYIVRYGGDEFIVVLPGYTADTGVDIAKSIYKGIADSNYFISKIEEVTHKTTVVPEKNRVSCSIGIAFMEDYNHESMNVALKHADNMLYNVKKNQKSNYRVYGQT